MRGAERGFKTRVYITDTSGLADSAVFERLYKTVSTVRQNKIDKYVMPKEKRLSLATGLLLKLAMRDCGVDNFQTGYGRYGKPYAVGEAVFFNLSHSENRAMCVISAKEAGCDVEKIHDIEFEIADRFFNPSECALLNSHTSYTEKREFFFRLWTLKESFMKATGMGMSLPLNSFSIDTDGGEITVTQNVSGESFYFREYELADGYRYAVCSMTPHFEDNMRIVSTEELI